MRHRGGGVGHKTTWHLNDMLLGEDANICEEGDEDSEMDENDENIEDEFSEEQESEDEDDPMENDASEGDESNSEQESEDGGYDDL